MIVTTLAIFAGVFIGNLITSIIQRQLGIRRIKRYAEQVAWGRYKQLEQDFPFYTTGEILKSSTYSTIVESDLKLIRSSRYEARMVLKQVV